MSAFLEVEHVSVSLDGRKVLSDISFSMRKGEVVALAGPSGSGKTSLLRIILGLLAPSHGVVRIDERVVSTPNCIVMAPDERGVGAVFQDLALWPHLTVEGNLAFSLAIHGLDKKARGEKIERALAHVGLAGFEKRRPQSLSGGEQQRVALARAFVTEPKLLALDEPLTNLDILSKSEILALLARLLPERAMVTLMVTHDPEEATRVAHRIAFIENGKLVQIGSPRELIAEGGATAFVRAFMSRCVLG